MAVKGRGEAITFAISVAAELSGMHPQTLRQYDRLGLVIPARTKGKGRRYTKRDVQRLRDVQRMSQEEGINLAGIRRILDLERRVEELEAECDGLRATVAASEARRSGHADEERPASLGGAGVLRRLGRISHGVEPDARAHRAHICRRAGVLRRRQAAEAWRRASGHRGDDRPWPLAIGAQ